MWKREEAEREGERREEEREKASRENQLGGHSSRVCTTSLCDFYTRSDFLAAPLALARQIYVPWPYKSRAYKDIEAKPTRISHPIRCALLFPPPSFPSPREHLLLDSRCPVIPFATILGIPFFFSTNRFLSPPPFSPPSGPKMGYKKTKNRRASPITGSVFLSSSRFPTPLTADLTTCWPAPYKLCIDNLLLGQLRIYWNIDDNACEK